VIGYDDATHTYTVDGAPYASVTQVIAEAGLYGDAARWFSERSRERGLMVHKTIESYYRDSLDVAALLPEVRGYFDAWLRFESDTGFYPAYVEEAHYHHAIKIAGRPDLIGPHEGAPTIIDIKTGAPAPATGIQLAGYEYIFKAEVPCHRLAVHLGRDGKYKLQLYNDRHDRDIFLAAVSIYNWRKANLRGG